MPCSTGSTIGGSSRIRSLTFRLEITGRATHGATRTRGVSAVEKFEVVHAADEHVAIADVLHSARTYALLAIRRCT